VSITQYATIAEMARVLGVSDVRCARIVDKLKLPVTRVGRWRFIDKAYKPQIKVALKATRVGRPPGAKNKAKV